MSLNQNPEQIARDKIDKMLEAAGWAVQSSKRMNHSMSIGIALREYATDIGPADYVLFINKKPVGIIEAKRAEEGQKITVVEEQSRGYAAAKLKYLNNEELPFVYESTGEITRFTDYREKKARGRNIFSFHSPQTLANWLTQKKPLRDRFFDLPKLDPVSLRPAQIVAIENLEESFQNNRPRALIQMATGAGKTFTATTFAYRLLKFAKAKRILFLVDTKNLGEQAEQEFMSYQPKDDNRKFTELYNVQRLSSNHISASSHICISTIQRLYSILKGDDSFDESAELENPNESTWMQAQFKKKKAIPVEYNKKVPIEEFDFIIIDECHRSIYNLWRQVLDYFDAYLIGLTATPDKRTFGFFNENVVSEYTYEESVTDGVNVPYEVYNIDTEISQKGSKIKSGWFIERRNKLTRKKRWQKEDEDTEYYKNDLDKKVVNVSQIRNIIKEFRRVLKTEIYPKRIDENGEYEVPKTLIFAKTDSHADDIINIIREEFAEGNDFCKKVTYKANEDPKSVLNRFRNAYYPRIAVTVDMIATGTDVKPLEVLLFMRDVRSVNYFEQMKGRGTRTIKDDDLQLVTKTNKTKTHFIIVDAVGAMKSKKTDSRPLERKPSVALKDLLGAVTMGVEDEDTYLSLANRLIRLDKQLSEKQQESLLAKTGGKDLKQITKELLSAFDADAIQDKVDVKTQELPETSRTPETLAEIQKQVQQELLQTASDTFNGELNEFLETIRRENEQIIDTENIDSITHSDWDRNFVSNAKEVATDFKEYLEKHKDEIKALSIFYNQPFKRKDITYKMIKELYEKIKLEKPTLSPDYVWRAYTTLEKSNLQSPKSELTALVSLIRHVCGIDTKLKPYDKTIDSNFKNWIFQQNKGKHNRFTPEQMDWLRLLKDHVTSSFHMELDDLDYTPFDSQGGRGKMYQLFGEQMEEIIEELNEALVA
ncbi:MAG: type I restriction-modification enzyme R subunit C-terminal domain-containing protein [Spirochaetota bacterium]